MDAAETDLVLWAAQPDPEFQGPASRDWRDRYRADMEVAVAVLDAARTDRMQIRWQPVIDAYASADTLYREGCMHLLPSQVSGMPIALCSVLPCLERLQLTRDIDRLAADRVLEALRRSPEADMSLNISATSARLDHWWATTFQALSQEPHLARRLVVEVNWVGVQWQDAEAICDFCRQLAVRGCRIAIDHFGADQVGLGALHACKPDIVKLEAQFIRRAGESQFGFDSLKHALALCANLASCVVVEGVDRAADLGVALRAGAQWMQGYYLGGPRAASLTSMGTCGDMPRGFAGARADTTAVY
jgi:EAL domain-containing protein (putative c-di-GMP-specific phosphodiesterase class I)